MSSERAPVKRWFTGPQGFLLAGSFLITLGSFAVLPYMSVLLHQRLGLGLGTVGFVLAVASLNQRAGGMVAAPVLPVLPVLLLSRRTARGGTKPRAETSSGLGHG